MNSSPETIAAGPVEGPTAKTRNDVPGHSTGQPDLQALDYYPHAKAPRPTHEVTLLDWIDAVRSDEFADPIAEIRARFAAGDEVAVDELKKKLPAVSISGSLTKGGRKQAADQGRFNHSGLLQIDLDGKDNIGWTVEEMTEILQNDPRIVGGYVSAKGNGVKGFARIAADVSTHLGSFLAAEAHFEKLNLVIDASVKDECRLCFVSHDPDAWIDLERTAVFEPLADQTPKPGIVIKGDAGNDWTLADLAEMLAPIPRPEYPDWLAICSGAWNHFGEAATEILADHWPEENPGEYAEKFKHRTKDHTLGTVIHHAEKSGWKARKSKGTTSTAGAPPPSPDVFREMLADRAFNAAIVPPKPVPVITLGGKYIGTAGNVIGLQAGLKSGKTAVVGAINAALFIGDYAGDHDTLGFAASNPEGHAVLHFDTEQSRYDHDGVIRRALARVGMEAPPVWFQSFCLTDLSQRDRIRAIEMTLADAVNNFGGVRAAILDGVADFMRDPNEALEAFSLVDKLHAAAITYDCIIVCVIHENPGTDTGKTRGHLGSQLARKAETNLRLHKDTHTGITTIWADAARHCHISKEEGTCFAWCDLLGRHVSKGTAKQVKASVKTEKFRAEAEKAFGDASSLNYSALVTAIMKAADLKSNKTAEKRVKDYQIDGIVIKHQSGNYSLK